MPKVDISINGRLYAVACDEGQETRVRDLATMVDERVRQLAGPNPMSGIGETQLLVLAGLMLADELNETQAKIGQAPAPHAGREPAGEEEELLIAAVDHLAERIGVIADKVQQA